MSNDPQDFAEIIQLHEAMEQVLRAALPQIQYIEAYPDVSRKFPCPALFFGMSEFDPGRDPGTGRLGIRGTFNAAILVDRTVPQARLVAVWLAMRLAGVLRAQYWGVDFADAAQDIQARPEPPRDELASFVVWSVQWTHWLAIGVDDDDDVFAAPASAPVDWGDAAPADAEFEV